MLTKEEVRKTKWWVSKYHDFAYWVPADVEIGDVGFCGDVDNKLVMKEFKVIDKKLAEEFPEKGTTFAESYQYYKARQAFLFGRDRTVEFLSSDDIKGFVVAIEFTNGNPDIEAEDLNVVFKC